jgi:hypothetical protein
MAEKIVEFIAEIDGVEVHTYPVRKTQEQHIYVSLGSGRGRVTEWLTAGAARDLAKLLIEAADVAEGKVSE